MHPHRQATCDTKAIDQASPQTTNLMPISGCDKVRPMNSASNLQFFLLHAATLPSRGTCYRQVPRGDWQHRREGPHPQRMSSWGDPSTDISDISASKLQWDRWTSLPRCRRSICPVDHGQIFATHEGMIQYHENEVGPGGRKDSCSKFISLVLSHGFVWEVGWSACYYNNSDAPDFWTNPHPFPKVLALHPPEGC